MRVPYWKFNTFKGIANVSYPKKYIVYTGQETATVYPIVVFPKVDGALRDDHLVFVSDDKKHDVPIVERCNDLVNRYYLEEGLSITQNIEYNYGCASQFKCIIAFVSFARCPRKTTCVFTDTSHGKSKSDRLGGVVKYYASHHSSIFKFHMDLTVNFALPFLVILHYMRQKCHWLQFFWKSIYR